jgi:nitronate monooxygenase
VGVTTTAQLRALSRWPIVVSPMAGGPTTPALVAAAAEAGAFGFLAGGYKTPTALATEIESVRVATGGAFGVNLFVPGEPAADPGAVAAYVGSLETEAAALGAEIGLPRWDDDEFAGKVDVVLADPPAAVSFTFGCPSPDVLHAVRGGGSMVVVTVTTPDEAARAEEAGADCLCLQGSEAGAHRGSFSNDDQPGQDWPLLSLLAKVAALSELPLIAAGGMAGPLDVAAALEAGATVAQLGTAFLRCRESGANEVYKAALADPRFTGTAITRAFSGRRARALVNGFVRGHGEAPAAYPEINNATRTLRAAATAQADADHMSLYAGEGFRGAEERTAGEIIERLVSGLPQ